MPQYHCAWIEPTFPKDDTATSVEVKRKSSKLYTTSASFNYYKSVASNRANILFLYLDSPEFYCHGEITEVVALQNDNPDNEF